MARILYLTADDATLATSENNGYYIGEALHKSGAIVDDVMLPDFTLVEKFRVALIKAYSHARHQTYRAKSDPLLIQRRTKRTQKIVNFAKYDLIFSNSGVNLGFLAPHIRTAFYTDAPIAALKELGHYFDDWSAQRIEDYIALDRRAVMNAEKVIYHTTWAMEYAAKAYGVDRSRLAVIAPGANLPWIPRANANVNKERLLECHLLFFGRDWIRKGGPQAQEIVRYLNTTGVKAILHVCGPSFKPKSIHEDKSVMWHRPINKLSAADIDRLATLMSDMDYMLLPTRADTSTSAIREACAFGVPSIVTGVGGLGSMVLDGNTGLVVGSNEDSLAIASRINENFTNDSQRISFQRAARHQYESRFNWPVAIQGITEALQPFDGSDK